MMHDFVTVGKYQELDVMVCNLCGMTAMRGDTVPADCGGVWD